MRQPIRRSIPLLLGLLALSAANADGLFGAPDTPPAHTARYAEITAGRRTELVAREWRVDGGLLLESTSSTGEHHLVRVDPQLRTVAWRFEGASPPIAIESVLREGKIVVESHRAGDVVHAEVSAGNARWVQSIERSLREFILTGTRGDRLRFQVIQPDTLTARTLQARLLDTEELRVAGELLDVRHVRISLPGIGALIWRSDYWFRASDGLFVESRVTRGPPGTPETVVMLLDDSGPAPRR